MGITLDKIDAACNHSVKISDGTNVLSIDGSGFITANINGTVEIVDGGNSISIDDNGGSLTVDFTRLDATTDNVGISDGTNALVVNADGSINVQASFDLLGTAWQVAKKTVTTTSSQLDATPLADREKVLVQNLGPADIYLKNTTATVNDLCLPCGASMEMPMTDALALHAITAAGSADVRLAEFK